MSTTDQELWSAITAGDPAAFAVLFDRYARAMYNHAFKLTGSWSLAEDVTQSAFLAAWRRRADARLVDGSALPWLLVITANTARTESRSARRWLALLRRLPAERETDGALSDAVADEVAGRIDDERRMRTILAAVRRLPRAEREAIALCVWSGVSYADAAAVLGVTEVAIRSRISRARARLARQLVPAATPQSAAPPASPPAPRSRAARSRAVTSRAARSRAVTSRAATSHPPTSNASMEDR